METLINLINNKQIINEEEVMKIVESFKKEKDLYEYLKKFKYSIDESSGYFIHNKTILLNEVMTMDLGNKFFDSLNNDFDIDKNNKSYYLNYYYLYEVFHELTHAFQHKRDDNGYKRSYSYLNKLSENLHKRNMDYYQTLDGHDLFPLEIEADNVAFSKAYKIMKITNIPKKDLKILYTYYLNVLLYNYSIDVKNKKTISPIEALSKDMEGINM